MLFVLSSSPQGCKCVQWSVLLICYFKYACCYVFISEDIVREMGLKFVPENKQICDAFFPHPWCKIIILCVKVTQRFQFMEWFNSTCYFMDSVSVCCCCCCCFTTFVFTEIDVCLQVNYPESNMFLRSYVILSIYIYGTDNILNLKRIRTTNIKHAFVTKQWTQFNNSLNFNVIFRHLWCLMWFPE